MVAGGKDGKGVGSVMEGIGKREVGREGREGLKGRKGRGEARRRSAEGKTRRRGDGLGTAALFRAAVGQCGRMEQGAARVGRGRQFLRRRWKRGGIFYGGNGKNAVYIRSSMW